MRSPCVCALSLLAVLGGCGAPPAPVAEPVAPPVDYGHALFPTAVSSSPSAVAPPVASSVPLPETGPATWTPTTDEQGPLWVRSHGGHAPDLVIRGTTSPTNPDYMARGAREGELIRVKTEGKVPHLRIWLRARGPVELIADGESVEGTVGDTLVVDLTRHVEQLPGGSQAIREGIEGIVYLRVRDIDRPKERRGQSSPYVLVIGDDESAARNEMMPDARPAVAADAMTVRWDLTPVPCVHSEYQSVCYRAAMVLGNGTRVALHDPMTAQSACMPDGAAVLCAGASGGTRYDVELSANGRAKLMSHFYSDGACDVPDTDCGTHTRLADFRLPRGTKLIPDPLGTMAPLPPSAFEP